LGLGSATTHTAVYATVKKVSRNSERETRRIGDFVNLAATPHKLKCAAQGLGVGLAPVPSAAVLENAANKRARTLS